VCDDKERLGTTLWVAYRYRDDVTLTPPHTRMQSTGKKCVDRVRVEEKSVTEKSVTLKQKSKNPSGDRAGTGSGVRMLSSHGSK
jgi:hypothetical protein